MLLLCSAAKSLTQGMIKTKPDHPMVHLQGSDPLTELPIAPFLFYFQQAHYIYCLHTRLPGQTLAAAPSACRWGGGPSAMGTSNASEPLPHLNLPFAAIQFPARRRSKQAAETQLAQPQSTYLEGCNAKRVESCKSKPACSLSAWAVILLPHWLHYGPEESGKHLQRCDCLGAQ